MKDEFKRKIIIYLFSLLKDVQKEMFNLCLQNTISRKYVIHCSRRLGKTFLLIVLCCIVCYSQDDAQIRYASVTQKAVRKMIHPIFKQIFLKVKPIWRPKWNSQEGAYIFPNGSMVHIAGVNGGHSDDLRGTAADLCVVDEAAFVDELKYLIDSVLMPQLITTGGKLLIASSSPVSPAHEFADFIHEAKIEGFYSSFNIHQGGFTKEIVDEFMKEAKGPKSTAWRREYLNQIIVDSEYAIIPEAEEFLKCKITDSENKFYYHKYVSMDIGTRDLTAILFGYYDFKRATLCIEREFLINGPEMTTPKIAKAIKEIELELWDKQIPLKRVSDNNNLLLLQDLGYLHDCHFIPTGKDSLEAMVNEVRIWVKDERVEIDPSCLVTIESLMFGFWNEQRSGWGRSKTLGHFDAIAALMYLIRNIDTHTNPIPTKVSFDQIYIAQDNGIKSALNSLTQLRG